MVAGPPKVMFKFVLLAHLVCSTSALLSYLFTPLLERGTFPGLLHSTYLFPAIPTSSHYSLRRQFYHRIRRSCAFYSNKVSNQAALDIAMYLLLSGLYLDHLTSTLREDLGVILGKLSTADPALQGRQSKLSFTRLGNEPKIATLHLLTALRL